MKTNRYIPIFAAAALLAACAQEIERPEPHSGAAVEFAAAIAPDAPATRTTSGGNSWVLNDSVGIYMLKADGSPLASNVYYYISNLSDGTLSPKGTPIYYPVTGNVDFVAYYPAGTVRTPNYTYSISVIDQQTEAQQNQLDVMWADRRNVAPGTAVSLSFRHVMSKITLNVMAGKNFESNDVVVLPAANVAFNGMPAGASLRLQDGTLTPGAKSAFSPRKVTPPANSMIDASFTAILVPQEGSTKPTGRTATFTFDSNVYTWAIPDTTNFVAGKHYVYPVTINRDSIIVDASEVTAADWEPHPNDPGEANSVGTVQDKIAALEDLLEELEEADKNKTVAVLREEDLTAITPAVLAILNDPILNPYKTLQGNIDELDDLKKLLPPTP